MHDCCRAAHDSSPPRARVTGVGLPQHVPGVGGERVGTVDEVRVRLLGPIRLLTDGPRVVLPLPAKLAQLLAILSVRVGRPLSVEEIAGNMWSKPPPTHRELVRQYVAALRRMLGQVGDLSVETELGSYTLEAAYAAIDLWHFEAAATLCEVASREHRWAEAIDHANHMEALWAGRPFHGADYRSSPLLTSEAVRLDELRDRSLELLALALAADGKATLAIARLKAQVVESPLREPTYVHLMRLLAQQGRTAEAIAVYQQLEQTLVRRVGLTPGPETRRLMNEIRSQD